MKTHEFTLVLSGHHEIDSVAEKIYGGGCDDATVSECRGAIAMDFMRDAATFEEAVLSAIRNVMDLGYAVANVDPDDYVNEQEIARRTGRTRQSIHLLISGQRGKGGFPAPATHVTSSRPLWHWHEVAQWLKENGIWGDDDGVDRAVTVALTNAALEVLKHEEKSVQILAQLRRPA